MNDLYYLRIAQSVALASKDPSSQIGAVLVHHGKIVATGYNRFPVGIAQDHRMGIREKKLPLVVHAEMDALLSGTGTELFVFGFQGPPCSNCMKHILHAGIQRVVTCGVPLPERWKHDCASAWAMLKEAGILYTEYPLRDLYNSQCFTVQELQ